MEFLDLIGSGRDTWTEYVYHFADKQLLPLFATFPASFCLSSSNVRIGSVIYRKEGMSVISCSL